MKSFKVALDEGRKYLVENNIDNGKEDAWHLFSHLININRAEYFLNSDKQISDLQYDQYMKLIKKRANNHPLQYIIGYQEFMGLKIKVNKDVLIPRLDTEILVEEVLKVSRDKEILDLCTGSGCIIISLMKYGNINSGLGADISKAALAVARENALINEENVNFIESDLFSNVEGRFDIIVSNPPYIPKDDIRELSKEVRVYEPHLALDGREDGLYYYRQIAKELKQYLKPKGIVFFEIGYNQAEALIEILEAEGIEEIEVVKDLAGLDRIIKGRL